MEILGHNNLVRTCLIFLLFLTGCSTGRMGVSEFPVEKPKKTVLVLLKPSSYKMRQINSLAQRMSPLDVELFIENLDNALEHRAIDYGLVLLMVSFKKGEPFSYKANAFLKENEEAENIILFVSKQKKYMQLPKEIAWGGVIDTVTTASFAKNEGDIPQLLAIILKDYYDLEGQD